MAITQTELTSGQGVATPTATTASISPTANALLIAYISFHQTSRGAASTCSLSGNGLTWTQVNSTISCNAPMVTQSNIAVFKAQGASPSAGVVTITIGGSGGGCSWSIQQWGTSGGVVQSASNVQVVSGTSTGTVTLASFASASNGTSAGFCSVATTGTPTSPLLLDSNTTGTFVSQTSCYQLSNNTTPTATWASTSWAALALEINYTPLISTPTGNFFLLFP